jgi:DnaJ-class molecular chaperone
MPELDYYKVLGVSRDATADDIRKAYKKLARENHPDMKPNDKAAAEKFKQVQAAYDVLGDADKRSQYDRYGAAFQQAGRGPAGGRTYTWNAGPGGAGGPVDLDDLFGGGQVDLGDLFGGMFGGRGPGPGTQRRPRARRGQDIEAEINVPFQLAAEGGSYDLQLERGGQPERIAVKVPPGVNDGSVIRLAGQGQPGFDGGPGGDLLLTIQVAPHPYFRREGRDLFIDVPITPSEAALGAKIDVPTLSEGRVTVTVPPGTSSGTKLRLRGKGVADPKSKQRGDQFVVVKISVPKKHNEEARELYRKLADAAPFDPREGLW